MKKPVLDDHLIETKKEKLKRPIISKLKLKGFTRLLGAQGLAIVSTRVAVSVVKGAFLDGDTFITPLLLIFFGFICVFIMGYNIYMGWLELIGHDLFDYGKGAMGVLIIILIVIGMYILSVIIFYGANVIKFERLLAPIVIISLVAFVRYIYDSSKSY